MATSTELFANNAGTTLASNMTTGTTTAVLSPGTGTLFPNPGANQYFLVTLTDAATKLLIEIVKVTARSGDTLTVVRAQEGTSAQAWSTGDIVQNRVTAGSLSNFAQISTTASGRIRLGSNLNFYVATTGSDSNTGLSSGSPWATLQNAWDTAFQNYDLNGFNVTVNIADGTYAVGVAAIGSLVGGQGSSAFSFISSSGSNTACLVSASATAFSAVEGAQYSINNIGISTSSGACVSVSKRAEINHSGCRMGVASRVHNEAINSATIFINSTEVIAGNAPSHFSALNNGVIAMGNGTAFTLSGTPTFSGQFASANGGGIIYFSDALSTFTGSASGPRYSAILNGVINTMTGNTSFLPGSTSGSTATGGQYA